MNTSPTVRFIILANGRTGSNLLQASINQHPAVTAYGELFHSSEEKRAKWPIRGRYYRAGEDAIAFLEETAFAPPSDPAKLATGFRIFYGHSRQDSAASRVWDYLAEDRDVRVIHLVRNNLLESFVSESVARRTGEWLRRLNEEAPPAPDPFEADVRECEKYFNNISSMHVWAREHFAGHPFLELSYEEMCSEYQATLDRTFELLGVAPVPVCAPYRKQASRPVRDQLSNFAQLREAFLGTPYERFFD
jgi:LPS sulfotransferase NodH